VHNIRNVLAQARRGKAEMVAAAIRRIFAQPVHSKVDVIAGMLGRQIPQVEAMLRDAEADLLASGRPPTGASAAFDAPYP
jgi:hypothetical protein